MYTHLNTPFTIGNLTFPNRLIQGPLAGFSCAPFRELFSQYQPPAYCVSEMISAYDLVHKPIPQHRYIYRSARERRLCYQIAGNDPQILAKAAYYLNEQGADLIDINCGCPKLKIRKKGAGSALLADSQLLINIVTAVKSVISCPLTLKLRIQDPITDLILAKQLADAGVDALIVHGRRWMDDYSILCDLEAIQRIKQTVTIPIIANGDIACHLTLQQTIEQTKADAFMISRAGTGKPWLYQMLLTNENKLINYSEQLTLFIEHLQGLAVLESEYKAVLQSRKLVTYYFKHQLSSTMLAQFYTLNTIDTIYHYLRDIFIN